MDSSVRWNNGFPAPVIPGPLAEPGMTEFAGAEGNTTTDICASPPKAPVFSAFLSGS